MASLQDMLIEESFRSQKHSKSLKQKNRIKADNSIALPIYICHDRRSIDFSMNYENPFKRSGSSKSKKIDSKSAMLNVKSEFTEDVKRDEPAIDEVAIRAVISILSGYVGRYARDEDFRKLVHEKCHNCLSRKKTSDNPVLTNLELGIRGIEKLASNPSVSKESKIRYMRNSIRVLSIVASLKSSNLKNDCTCGIPNSHLSACAEFYLSIVYKLDMNDLLSSRHLLQVFCDSPFLARKHLIPDLWEHLFLPHLLPLNIWYDREMKFIDDSHESAKCRNLKILKGVYNDEMDRATVQFAVYYKEWLNVTAKTPTIPCVSIPSSPNYGATVKNLSTVSPILTNKSLHRAVFGSSFDGESIEWEGKEADFLSLDDRVEILIDQEMPEQREVTENDKGVHRRSASQSHRKLKKSMDNARKTDYLGFLSCSKDPEVHSARYSQKPDMHEVESDTHYSVTNLSRSISILSEPNNLTDSELAIRIIAKAWINSYGDSTMEKALSQTTVIKGLLEILRISESEEILELIISILAELVIRNDENREVVLHLDPQLEILAKLLGNRALFLKASILLYLLKPKAEHLQLSNWIQLILPILRIDDHPQTLFFIRCRPQTAGYYILDQFLTGFDVDKNLENARQVISMGGLRLLMQRFECGDSSEKKHAASLLCSCIQADGSCRNFVANNINKLSILELLQAKPRRYGAQAFSLLIELICLERSDLKKFLNDLKNESYFNTMHILLVYLQRAPPEQRPLVSSILLMLDFMGDPMRHGHYQEVIDNIIVSLDCSLKKQKVQEQSGRALLLLGGYFSNKGEPLVEKWLLKKSGLDYFYDESLGRKDFNYLEEEEEKMTEDWLRKATIVLLTNGREKFLLSLSKSIEDGIPRLSKACLITVAWMSSSISIIHNFHLHLMACTILVPKLIEKLKDATELKQRVLASLSLLNFARNSECLSFLCNFKGELVVRLEDLTNVTWTAKELLSLILNDPFL